MGEYIKIDLRETRWKSMDGIDLAQEKWRALVSMAINIRVP
jgi:hypothetical protein